MADATQMFMVGIPTLIALIGILVNNSRLSDLNNRIMDLRQDMNRRFDDVDRRSEDVNRHIDGCHLLRFEFMRVENR